jgi:glycosyltransferase involved in cell wall biosynthesis
MLEPLGEGQVVAYLEHLASGRPIHLLSFEKPQDLQDTARMGAMRSRLAAAGVAWYPRRYHKSPSAPATAWDILAGTAQAFRIARRHGIRIVHARSYVSGCMALALKRIRRMAFVFDMRGLWVDERVEGGLWPADGALFRFGKVCERRLLLAADHVVTLTRASAGALEGLTFLAGRVPPISVIPTCVDLSRFPARAAPPDGPLTLGHVGSVGTWGAFDQTLAFFNAVRERRPEARLLVVSRSDHGRIREMVANVGVPEACVEVRAADYQDVARQMHRMHAGMAFYRPGYSRIATAPTKLAEYLACGIPCIINDYVGDVEEILEGDRVGVAMKDASAAGMERVADRLLALLADPGLHARCVAVARNRFALDRGVAAYEAIYAQQD